MNCNSAVSSRVQDAQSTTAENPVLSFGSLSPPANSELMALFAGIAADIHRIANVLDPAPSNVVGTPYVAKKLGVTTTWIADLIRRGEIPDSCLVAGTGNGKPWKFHRERIDQWLVTR